MLCNKCGRAIEDGANFCPVCGADLRYQRNSHSGYVHPNDETNFGYTLLSFFIPYIGLILYIVWFKEFPKRAKSCLNGIIAGMVCIVVLFCCIFSGMTYSNRTHHDYSNSIAEEISIQDD